MLESPDERFRAGGRFMLERIRPLSSSPSALHGSDTNDTSLSSSSSHSNPFFISLVLHVTDFGFALQPYPGTEEVTPNDCISYDYKTRVCYDILSFVFNCIFLFLSFIVIIVIIFEQKRKAKSYPLSLNFYCVCALSCFCLLSAYHYYRCGISCVTK